MSAYTIEAMEDSGRWHILGSAKTSGDAQDRMADHRRLFPKLPLRVVEARTRKLIICNDPR